ncbi:hypothetical protein HK096_005982, partial [Nowakowskiella sp. JEL0078]
AINVTVVTSQTFVMNSYDGSTAQNDLANAMQMLKQADAHIVISFHTTYWGYFIVNEANRYNLIGKNYFWMFRSSIEDSNYGLWSFDDFIQSFPAYTPYSNFPELTRGVTIVARNDYVDGTYDDMNGAPEYRLRLKNFITSLNLTATQINSLYDDVAGYFPKAYMMDTYDAIWAYAKTVDRIVNKNNLTLADFVIGNIISPASVKLSEWIATNYSGVTGPLNIDLSTGSRISAQAFYQYTGLYWNSSRSDPRSVWKKSLSGNVTTFGVLTLNDPEPNEPFINNTSLVHLIWPGNLSSAPLDHTVYQMDTVSGTVAGLAFAIIYAIMILLYVISMIILYIYRGSDIIRRKSPTFGFQVLVSKIYFSSNII